MLFFFLAMLETPEDKQKFAELYEANRGLMFSTAKAILHDDSFAEDAVHEAFVRLIKHFNKLEEFTCNQIRNYLVIIVKNAAIDIYNERRKMTEISFDEAYETDGRYADSALDARLDYEELLEVIDQLPEIYSEALYLSYHLGLSVNEIAASLSLSVSAVKLRLMRARQKLRALLEEVKT